MSSPPNPNFPPPLRASHSVQEAPGLLWSFQRSSPAGDLPDINIWLALAIEEHPHHARARAYWQQTQADNAPTFATAGKPFIWFCRTTMLGMVRLLCQPKAVGAGALDLTAAWHLYQQYRALPQIGLQADPADCESQLSTLLGTEKLPTRLWTDAYLAALAQASGMRLVTFDRDFQRFNLTRCLILPTA
jgi:toxin-antitoxin system PIN domain toxin